MRSFRFCVLSPPRAGQPFSVTRVSDSCPLYVSTAEKTGQRCPQCKARSEKLLPWGFLSIWKVCEERKEQRAVMLGSERVAEGETKNPANKALKPLKSDRRNSSAEVRQMDRPLDDAPTGEKLQTLAPPLNLLRRQSLRNKTPSPTLSDTRPTRSLLHPEHAKLIAKRKPSLLTPPPERYALSLEEAPRETRNGGFTTSPLSSSAASSVASIPNGATAPPSAYDHLQSAESRRSSTMTNKYSLLDALDLEYALIKAAARGSIGPYSLSQSLQKLTFTQSLAFPALARGLSSKRNSKQRNGRGPVNSLDSGVSAFVKVTTVLVLMLISVLVFGVLYKFIRT